VRRRAARSEALAGWSFALPAALLIGVFGIVPIGWALLLSFQHNDLLGGATWAGTANYRQLADDPVFRDSVWRTVVYTVLFVPVSVGGGLAVAVLLHARIRFSWFYRTAVFVPVATSTVATGVIFNWLLEPTYGLVNYVVGLVGLGPYGFFQDPDQALLSVVAMTAWGWIGFDVIIFLAALQGIPADLYEASTLDGAGRWDQFRSITLPLLRPTLLFGAVVTGIGYLQFFEEPFVMTRGGPLSATLSVSYHIYNQFGFGNYGYAAAASYVLFLAVVALSVIQFRLLGERD
jgi:multiple sugar transport system permease protein